MGLHPRPHHIPTGPSGSAPGEVWERHLHSGCFISSRDSTCKKDSRSEKKNLHKVCRLVTRLIPLPYLRFGNCYGLQVGKMLTSGNGGQRVMGTLHHVSSFFKSLNLFQNIKVIKRFRAFLPTGSHSLLHVLTRVSLYAWKPQCR